MKERPFGYNPSESPISGTLQIGSLAIGDSFLDYSSKPGGITWWMGPDEIPGYVVANVYPPSNLPTPVGNVGTVNFWRTNSKSDSSFIELANYISDQLGGSGPFATATDAKNWINSVGLWTSYPENIKQNLIVNLDAGNPTSYSGSGNIWYDLEGDSNNATLFNTPVYSSTYGGILKFDDNSSEYATISDIGDLSNWTIEVWFRINAPLSGKCSALVTNQFNLISKLNFSIGTNNFPSNSNIAVGFYNGVWRTTAGFAPTVGQWYQVVGTYDGSVIRQYVNGTASGGTLNYTGTPQSGGEIRMMRRWDDVGLVTSNLIDGDLAIVRIYSSALNSSEALQNYNSDKIRFGL